MLPYFVNGLCGGPKTIHVHERQIFNSKKKTLFAVLRMNSGQPDKKHNTTFKIKIRALAQFDIELGNEQNPAIRHCSTYIWHGQV